jgi:hypothetical protein
MSVSIINDRLAWYNCTTDIEETQAVREITQELILSALGRTNFFKIAAFQGGTCLRILYALARFSEDLDFVSISSNPDFSWSVASFKMIVFPAATFKNAYRARPPARFEQLWYAEQS